MKKLLYGDVFRRFQIVTRTATQAELAAVLDIRQSSVSDARRRKAIPADWYLKLFEKLGINPNWLKYGTGPIRLCTDLGCTQAAGSVPENSDSSSLLRRAVSVPVYAMHGTFPDFPFTFADLEAQDRIALPQFYARPDIRVVAVDNEAAAPLIRKGGYAGIDVASRYPAGGEVFAVVVPHEGIVLRRLYWGQSRGVFLLRAENPACPELSFSPDECRGRLLGRLAWVLQHV